MIYVKLLSSMLLIGIRFDMPVSLE